MNDFRSFLKTIKKFDSFVFILELVNTMDRCPALFHQTKNSNHHDGFRKDERILTDLTNFIPEYVSKQYKLRYFLMRFLVHPQFSIN